MKQQLSTSRLIGAHVSAAGGVEKALERASTIGARSLQIFSGSPRVWARPKIESFDPKKITAKQKELSVAPIIIHALYLINLAGEKPELRQKSQQALVFDLRVDSLIGGSGVVVHLGSHTGRGWEAVREQVAQSIVKILEMTPENSTFLIENSAGQKGKLVSDLNDLRWLLDKVNSPRLGWCVDTCHSWAAGYRLLTGAELNLTKPSDHSKAVVETLSSDNRSLPDEIERLKLWSSLKCIHVNDSRDPFASGRDRHANLLEGSIPSGELASFLAHEKLKHLPLILEVPGQDKSGPNEENIQKLIKLTSGK